LILDITEIVKARANIKAAPSQASVGGHATLRKAGAIAA